MKQKLALFIAATAAGLSAVSTQAEIVFSAIQLESNKTPEAFQEAPVVQNVVVKGNQRVETNTVISFLGVVPGAPVTPEAIDTALNTLLDSGLFADAAIEQKGSTLVVTVEENPIVNSVRFEGNKKIDDDILEGEVALESRGAFSKSVLQQDANRILQLYQRKGRFATRVDPQIVPLSQNRVDVVFEVDEGNKTDIQKINFVGNEAFSNGRLKRVIETKEDSILRFWSGADIYDEDRLAYDEELLRRFYNQNGYPDFQIVSANGEIAQDQGEFYVTFVLDEGPKYRFGDFTVQSELPYVKTENLDDIVDVRSKQRYDSRELKDAVNAITEELSKKGYAFVEVSPLLARKPEQGLVDVAFRVSEGPRVYVENIDINGNVRTLDKVVRREFRLAEGDPYNSEKIKRSLQRVRNLGFFSNVDVETTPGSAVDKIDVALNVDEKSTGELTFGAGFSSNDGPLGEVSLTERNLLGRGQYAKLSASISSISQQFEVGFTEPYFLGKDFALGFDAFKVTREGNNSRSNLAYDSDSFGGKIRASYPISEHLRHSLRYEYRSDDIDNIDPAASLFVQGQAGDYTTSSIGHTLTYDRRDNRFDPTEGFYVRLNQDYAGLGGDAEYHRHEVQGAAYFPIYSDDVIFKLSGRAGYIEGLNNQNVRINDRFFVGGRLLRGFDNEGIGPRDRASLDPIGGNSYYVGTAELQFPLGLPEELGFKGSVFVDAGSLFDNEDADANPNAVFDEDDIRASVGAGISWKSPIGPIRIDYAHAFQDQAFDETEKIRFSFGTQF